MAVSSTSVCGCLSRSTYRPRSSIVHNLMGREISGTTLLAKPFGNDVPERLSMPMESILPAIALQNGHIFLGFTDCGRFLLSYTIREEFENTYSRNEMAFIYKLHIWLFTPYRTAKRVASTVLFSNSGVADNNLLIDISQWRDDNSRLVILGRNYSPEVGGVRSLFYVTMTTLPSTSACPECCRQNVSSEFDETFNIHGVHDRGKCLRHCLTTHLVYERVPPFPKFDFDIQLRLKNSIVLNTGNALHIFTYNVSGPQEESTFVTELLIPPKHHEPRKSRKRFLRCDFWFKSTSNCLQKILSNCSAREASRIINLQEKKKTDNNPNCDLEDAENCIAGQEALLSCIPLSMTFTDPLKRNATTTTTTTHTRRLSQSSVDSELSVFSTLSRSTNLSQPSTTMGAVDDFQEIEPERPKSPPKKVLSTAVTARKVMPPPQRRRKFFKTGQIVKKSPSRIVSVSNPSTSKSVEKSYDIFDVSVEEVLLERSLSSYRKRRNADKQYEFSDPDISSENFVPLKLARNRRRRFQIFGLGPGGGGKSPRSAENSSPTPQGYDFTQGYDPAGLGSTGLGFQAHPRSPRSLTVHSPAMSPNYSELGDILRPLTNYTNLSTPNAKMSPTHPLFSPPLTRDFCEGSFDTTKLYYRTSADGFLEDVDPGSGSGVIQEEMDKPTDPTFTTSANCIAKILRCYVDKDDDNLSVKTDTDDEYNQTVPFPVALNLDVHGTGYRNLQLINNSKVNCSLTPVVEVLQRTLEIEILCNEVAGMICLSADKNFISCFDYDVAILDVCAERGNITAVAVVLIYASNLTKDSKYDPMEYFLQTTNNPNVPGQRQKYEAVFSFYWMPVEETCRILHIGHMREIDTTPENWHPTKDILQRLKENGLPSEQNAAKLRVLSNELAVFEWQSLDELVDSTSLIRLHSGISNLSSTLNSRSNSLTIFSSLSNVDLDTGDDDDLSDY